MAEIYTEIYSSSKKNEWNQFVRQSKNATFLFDRDFMDYHQDRFQDFSLMIYEKNKLLALLPANRLGKTVFSHQGLTYGGLVFNNMEKVTGMEKIFHVVLEFLRAKNISELLINILPSFYSPLQGSGMEYFLFQQKAKLIGRKMTFAVPLQDNLKLHKSKKKIYNKDFVKHLFVKEAVSPKQFWNEILKPVLKNKYEAAPIHSLEEIEILIGRFPENIQQYNVFHNDEIIAGMTLFMDNGVVKSQYGAVAEAGKKYKALDFLYMELFEKFRSKGYRYFDLGTTSETNFSYNKGLTNYKEELGGIPVNLDRYSLSL